MDEVIAALIEQGKQEAAAAEKAAKEKAEQDAQKSKRQQQAQREAWIAAMLPDIPIALHPYIDRDEQVYGHACKIEVPECSTIWYNTAHRKPFSVYVNKENFYFDADQIARCVAFARESWQSQAQRQRAYEEYETIEDTKDKAAYEELKKAQDEAAAMRSANENIIWTALQAARLTASSDDQATVMKSIALSLVVIASKLMEE